MNRLVGIGGGTPLYERARGLMWMAAQQTRLDGPKDRRSTTRKSACLHFQCRKRDLLPDARLLALSAQPWAFALGISLEQIFKRILARLNAGVATIMWPTIST